jgi:cyclopropane fatty-acyl-phospholipid synthase-like methyltransferase
MNFFGESAKRLAGVWHRLGGDRRLLDWVLALLEIQTGDRVIEIGCGPQSAMGRILRVQRQVYVVGVDVSEEAVALAGEKNTRAIRQGRAMLIQTDIAGGPPAFAAPFTKAVAVNAGNFWGRPVATLAAVMRVMTPGGKIAVAVQPREKEATAADALRLGKELRGHLTAAGFAAVRLTERNLPPAAAVCVTGMVPAGGSPPRAADNGRRRK